MNRMMDLANLLTAAAKSRAEQLACFSLLNLGMIESLANGMVTPTEALQMFYHAQNCLTTRRQLREKTADEIMSRGVQLPDLFEALPAEEAHREFQHELAAMRALCFALLAKKRRVA